MLPPQPNINALWAYLIIEECVRSGVTHFVVCPGSRSTPLTHAVAEHPKAQTTVHFDERGAAFHALGIAKATRRPAAFICTSGTAVANALPAVVEADAAQVPLLLLTADRPPELLDTGANQAIQQPGIYANYVGWETTLPCPDRAVELSFVLSTVDQAVHRASTGPAGPVHVNCMYREPLAPEPDCVNMQAGVESISDWANVNTPYTTYAAPAIGISDDDVSALSNILGDTKRGAVILGQIDSDTERNAAESFCRGLGWPVLPDIASGLRMSCETPHIVTHVDVLLANSVGDSLRNLDTVLHLGGAITSKRLLTLLEKDAPGHYLRVANHPLRHDPVHRVTHRITCSLAELEKKWPGDAPTSMDSDWVERIYTGNRTLCAHLDDALQSDELSEPGVAYCLSGLVPDHHTLYLGNSMPIRDWDMFATTRDNPPAVAANRGASGIDGNIATATGLARGSGSPVTAILGDLTALHDINSLALLRDPDLQVILVIINNDGGGIFSFLSVADHPKHFEKFWGTPHGITFAELAQGFGVRYANPQSLSELAGVYTDAASETASILIEVRTDREENIALHRSIVAKIQALQL